MDREVPNVPGTRPYGQACMNCFKAKCRCVSRLNGDGCERCHRLRKQCHPSDSTRRREAHKSQDPNTRIAQLEGKLDSVVSLLQSVTNPSGALTQASTSLADREGDAAAALLSMVPGISQPGNDSTAAEIADSARPSEAMSATLSPSPHFYEPSSCEAHVCLETFRSRMLPYCAFMHIPSHVSAQQLRQDRPFLFRAIVAVASPLTKQKLARGKELKQLFAQTFVLENKSSIDLLLSILTFVAWSHDQFLNRDGTLSRLIMMATSIIYDLRLNKPIPQDVHMIGHFSDDFVNVQEDGTNEVGQRMLEQQRAVLGCFVLSSIISSYFAQNDCLRWTPRMEEGLRLIEGNSECPTDATFAFQVRIQLLAQKAMQLQEHEENKRNVNVAASAPIPLYIASIQTQIDELRNRLPPELPQQEMLLAHLNYVELAINESVHSANSETPLIGEVLDSSTLSFERLDCLWRSLKAIKSWTDLILSLPPSAYIGFTFLQGAQLGRCLVVLFRLSTFQDAVWDREAVRNTVDILQLLEQLAHKYDMASVEAGEKSNEDFLAQFAKRQWMFRKLVQSKMAPAEGRGSDWTSSGTATSFDGDVVNAEAFPAIDFEDVNWLEKLMTGRR